MYYHLTTDYNKYCIKFSAIFNVEFFLNQCSSSRDFNGSELLF